MDSVISIDLYHKVMSMTKIWMVLILLTFLAFGFGYFEFVNAIVVLVLLISTFIKGQLVIDYFMNLKDVQVKYRFIPTLWLVLVLGSIALAYFLPLNP